MRGEIVAYTYSKQLYSGKCLCGHSFEDHHGNLVMNEEAYAVMGPRVASECEFFGCNEDGGLDENRKSHCWHYVDEADPDEAKRAKWEGTRR